MNRKASAKPLESRESLGPMLLLCINIYQFSGTTLIKRLLEFRFASLLKSLLLKVYIIKL